MEMSSDRLQTVGFQRLPLRWTRQTQYFSARFESAPYGTVASVRSTFLKMETKCVHILFEYSLIYTNAPRACMCVVGR